MKIVILFAKAGGGHESCAKSIKAQITHQVIQNSNSDDKIEVELIDILSKAPTWQQKLFCQSYVFLTEKTPALWSGLQILWKWDWLARFTSLPLKIQIWPLLKEIISQKPDKIICTYFLIDGWLEQLQAQSLSDNSKSIFTSTWKLGNNLSTRSNFGETKKDNFQAKVTVSNLGPSSSPESHKIPIWTVVTDIFSPHTVWFLAKNCHYIVFSSQAKNKALQRKIEPKNILELAPFFNPKFDNLALESDIKTWKASLLKNSINSKTLELEPNSLIENSKIAERHELEVQNGSNLSRSVENINQMPVLVDYQKLPTLLVVGGGESMPGGEKILRELLKLDLSFNLIFVCGRNQNLQTNCQNIVNNWQKQDFQKSINLDLKYPKNIQIHGFSQQLYEFMSVADLVVCKAGPATILECISQKKPILISHFIWEQEIGNRDFVLNHNLGYYEPNPTKLASLVKNLLSSPQALTQISHNYKKIKLENGLVHLTDFIINC